MACSAIEISWLYIFVNFEIDQINEFYDAFVNIDWREKVADKADNNKKAKGIDRKIGLKIGAKFLQFFCNKLEFSYLSLQSFKSFNILNVNCLI